MLIPPNHITTCAACAMLAAEVAEEAKKNLRLLRAAPRDPRRTMSKKKKPPAPLTLYEVADEMEPYASQPCHCDFPPPGEFGTIECTRCAVLRWQHAVLAAIIKGAK